MVRIGRVFGGVAAIALITTIFKLLGSINLSTAGFAYLITVLLIAARWGLIEAVIASIVAGFCLDYYFTPPFGTLHIHNTEDLVALAAFLFGDPGNDRHRR